MEEDKKNVNFTRYVLLGSFVGSLIGATAAMFAVPQSTEERKQALKELQRDLFKPVKMKFAELVEHIGDTLKRAIDEAASETEPDSVQIASNEIKEES